MPHPSAWCLAAVVLLVPSAALAQRELHWDAIEVNAHLDASGTLDVFETQTMVFTGDWNGGERRFTLHPRQRLSFDGIYRMEGGWRPLSEDSRLNDVDDWAWTDRTTLRWRSRLPSDPPFAGTTIGYQLRYKLSGILLKDDDGYRLDHDFAFRDRAGTIERFALRLTLDAAWAPMSDIRPLYTAGPLPPGMTFVLTLPLRYTGSGTPAILDLTRPREILAGVWILLGTAAFGLSWFFAREQRLGRFAPLETHVDESFLREHVLKYPAEIVGAIWDESIGPPEVVALIARMVTEGKLESEVGKGGKHASMTLRLKVDRSKLKGHERTLVERLFFNGRTETSTSAVRSHYRREGFDPADEIRRELQEAADAVAPDSAPPRKLKWTARSVFGLGVTVFIAIWVLGLAPGYSSVVLTIAIAVTSGFGLLAGKMFRAYPHWRYGEALLCLIPATAIAAGVAWYLWSYAGTGNIDLHPVAVFAIVAMALALTHASIDALKSRQGRQAMAFRKTLAAGRAFFASELRKAEPALRDEWYPWLLAFGLGREMDGWSAQQVSQRSTSERASDSYSSTPTSSSSTSSRWTGFAGGRSGGAGGGASWQAAAASMAATVSPPSSSGSSGGSSSGSSGGGSSSSGSSGGGGGGGW